MRLLLVNDDGINAEGIQTLAKELEKEYELTIVAPDDQRSASGHSITLRKPIVVKRVKIEGIKSETYTISGTPADCVRVALDKIVKDPLDLVVSGINVGVNLGADVLYSGTVSAAIEANMYKIPSIATSAQVKDNHGNFQAAAKYTSRIIRNIGDRLIEHNLVLNINTPNIEDEKIKGIKVCRIGGVIYDYYVEEKDENEEKFVIQTEGRDEKKSSIGNDTDRYYVKEGYVTVTPITYDLTNFGLLGEVESWF
ncbi:MULTISPECIES: 5'/3'-nucleotidase SurE [Tissierellales]|jgi:5'-nucleotidase|uniref:5'-nucleotidase SurE n=1 Tax=Acidilutibacter cellobiosedens TaxID=2507161 RepID=A0A410QH29_9FIRM|nr:MULTISPECIES: 5'/3'-nucleotidase SurE [Tissierellales]MBE6081237.1 5'/3'-nucleotidase SurE [Tissierellaceae bacterium]QAT63281.1 5'/3'-nucleotidase SurE [Acidilutibacter cellobiosedens]SCL95789.1 5'-nucleotidase SurE [Sporanaerobacter sp. PP17-6a]